MSDYTFRKAAAEELVKCTELADLAFENNFRTLLPKVYGENPVMRAVHHVADNRELRGLVAVLEDRLTVGEAVLKTGYVGSVCVHPDARGQGLMKKLMQNAERDMTADGTDIAFLNGKRQRYEYFGFVPAGVTYFFEVTGDNTAHALKDIPAENICFEEMISGSRHESRAREMYCSGPVHFERKEFAALCRSYYGKPYVVFNNGDFIGYVVADGDKNCWTEVRAVNAEAFDLMIKAWMEQNSAWKLRIILSEWESDLRRHLAGYAAGMSRGYSVQARIFRFGRVVEAYFKAKAAAGGISDGCMAFDIEGEAFTVTVKNGKVLVCEGGEDPIRLTAYEANRLMLLPFPVEGMPGAPGGWFPLEVSVAPDSPDAF